MRAHILFATCAALAATLACAGNAPPRSAGPAGVPKVGWVIMSGDRDTPDRDFVCQSEPASECLMPVSRAGAPVFAHVHVYYHPATTETKYTGSVRVPFFDGGTYEFQPNLLVGARGPVGNQSIVGIVTSKPGTYPLTIAVAATPPGGPAKDIRAQMPVIVK